MTLYIGLQLTHSGRFAKWHSQTRPDPIVAYAHPWLDRRFPNGVQLISDDDLDRLVDDFVARRAAGRRRSASSSSTSSTATAISATSCSARDRGRAGTAARSRTAPGSSPTSSPAFARRRRGSRSACGCRRSTPCRTVPDPCAPACPRRRPTAYGYAFGPLNDEDLDAHAGRRARVRRGARPARRPLALRHRRQSVLLPARAAAGAVSAERRLRAA